MPIPGSLQRCYKLTCSQAAHPYLAGSVVRQAVSTASLSHSSHCSRLLGASYQVPSSQRQGSRLIYQANAAYSTTCKLSTSAKASTPQSTTSKTAASTEAESINEMYIRRTPSRLGKECTLSDYKNISVSTSRLRSGAGHLAYIVICNPAKLNIFTAETINELEHAMSTLRSYPNLRVVILTGQTGSSHTASFCAGANILEMESISNREQARDFITRIKNLCNAMYTWEAVTIARIDGLCFGAGLELAACCDFRYGTQRSSFSMKEVAIGIPSVIHARLLANIMGWQAAKRMVLLGKVMGADEAHRANLLDGKFSTAEEMDAHIQEDAELVASYSQEAVRAQKELNLYWESHPLHSGIGKGVDIFAETWTDGGTQPKRYMRAWMGRNRASKSE